VENREALFEFLLRLGDDQLVLGHQLSMWCGHAPILEEDVALANIALDCLGQATFWLQLAGQIEGRGRDEDQLAYFRTSVEFRNAQLVERPNGDFAMTIVRQFFYDAFSLYLLEGLSESKHEAIAAIAAKSRKEVVYHVRHAREWVLRLGDGTEESHRRMQSAVDSLWIYSHELFVEDEIHTLLVSEGVVPRMAPLQEAWSELVRGVLDEATLQIPDEGPVPFGARRGMHSEYLGRMLSDMQSVARAHPGASW
jgi:ring-1,2-phenylacetyl-CoA epoxidase subunit PaaC